MTFTPSATSSFSAGAVFWGMIWATLASSMSWSTLWASRSPIPPDRAALDQCSQSRYHYLTEAVIIPCMGFQAHSGLSSPWAELG